MDFGASFSFPIDAIVIHLFFFSFFAGRPRHVAGRRVVLHRGESRDFDSILFYNHGVTEFDRGRLVLSSFTGFYLVLLGFT